MVDIERYKDAPLFAALIELNHELQVKNMPKITLNVVGGFALMVHGLRGLDSYTDIDFVGPDIAREVDSIAVKIGGKYHLEKHWINNDMMLTGTTQEDLEYATGKLHFHEAFKLSNIDVNVLDLKDLLRLKIISIDTSLSAVEFGGDFTRMKDFADVKALMEKLNVSYEDLCKEFKPYIYRHTSKALKIFLEQGKIALQFYVREMQMKNLQISKSYIQNNIGARRSTYLNNILNKAIRDSKER